MEGHVLAHCLMLFFKWQKWKQPIYGAGIYHWQEITWKCTWKQMHFLLTQYTTNYWIEELERTLGAALLLQKNCCIVDSELRANSHIIQGQSLCVIIYLTAKSYPFLPQHEALPNRLCCMLWWGWPNRRLGKGKGKYFPLRLCKTLNCLDLQQLFNRHKSKET